MYCTSVEKLIAIPIWEQQRIYRPERAQLLAQDIKVKLQEGKPLTLPGVSDVRHARVHAWVVAWRGVGWLATAVVSRPSCDC